MTKYDNSSKAATFKEMVKEVTNFYTLYKTPNRENIVEINRMVDRFPVFLFQVINEDLFEKVSKDIISIQTPWARWVVNWVFFKVFMICWKMAYSL